MAKKKTDREKGDELKAKRLGWGLTQIQLAERLGLHPISLSRFERGAESIPIMMEMALCELERRLMAERNGTQQPPQLKTKSSKGRSR